MTWLRTLALLAVPRDWRETVRGDLAADLARDDARRLSTGRYVVEAIRVGARLRWREKRLPAPVSLLFSLGRLPFELRLAVRSLRRAPWFTATVVGVMTLVLTLATTVFAIVDGVLFRPLPYPESERLFVVEPGVNGYPQPEGYSAPSASRVDLEHWSAAAPGVTFTGFSASGGMNFGVNDDTGVAWVRPEFFSVLGVRPAMGGFSQTDISSDPALWIKPAIITWELWQERFQARPDVIGHVEYARGSTQAGLRIVGVMPRGFWFPSNRAGVQVLQPEVYSRDNPHSRGLREVIARAPASMTADELRARVEAGMRAAAAAFPDRGPKPDNWSEAGWRREGPFDQATVVPLADAISRESRGLFSAAFAATMVLVLLGAVNASGLLAARAVDREREFRVRRALGAPSRAIARTVGAEVLLLFLCAAVFAVPMAQPVVRFVVPLLPEDLVLFKPWGAHVFDARVLSFAGLLTLTLALQASVWPARRAIRQAPVTAGIHGRGSERRDRGRLIVIAAQAAGALTLTVVGALLVGSLLAVYGQGLAIRSDNIIYIEARLAEPGSDMASRTARASPLLERLRLVPGVSDVALVAGDTLFGASPPGVGGGIFLNPDAPYAFKSPHTHAVTAGYFRILQPELVAGRFPSEREIDAGDPVALLAASVAEAYWPGDDSIGKTIRAAGPVAGGPRPYQVIGVVRDVPWLSWDTSTPMAYGPYAPLARVGNRLVTLLIETAGKPARVTPSVLSELESITPAVTVLRAGNLIDVFAETVNARRFRSWLFGGFAASALAVVGVGILGLLAMSTARRTREVGIRQALGATPGSIVRLFVWEQMRPVLAGLAIGVIVSAWAVGFVKSYLFGVTTTDPRVWGAAVILILVTAGAGALIPSMRASTTDPTIALRAE